MASPRKGPLTAFPCGDKSLKIGMKVEKYFWHFWRVKIMEMQERTAWELWLVARPTSSRSGRSPASRARKLQKKWSPGIFIISFINTALVVTSRWTETSALTGSNVDLLFLELAQEMLAKRQPYGQGVHQGPTSRGPGDGREVQQRPESSIRLLPRGASLRSKAQKIRKKPECCS